MPPSSVDPLPATSYSGIEMGSFLFNMLLGICIGRFLTPWAMVVFGPIVAVQVIYAIYMSDLDLWACILRGATLIVTANLAFLVGLLLRPASDKS